MEIPRIVIAGLSGDSGKTICCLSLIVALRQRGLKVSVFKKGPDYIDAAWLSEAAGVPCHNLDTYLLDHDEMLNIFTSHARETDISIIEGNRGIFDGKDAAGTHSTAELAKLLHAPVALCLNAGKTTRTLAALVMGCVSFDPGVKIRGVILNKIGGDRHKRIIEEAIHQYCHLPVCGAIPKLDDLIPCRHLGLIPPLEFREQIGQKLQEIANDYLDIATLCEIASKASALEASDQRLEVPAFSGVKIGYFRDSAFTFYYPENLEAICLEGAELVPISSLTAMGLPDISALYIGGGFPETHADELVRNQALFKAVREAIENGMPLFAECGGLIYLARSLTWKGQRYPMVGVFPVDLAMQVRPVGHGYTMLRVDRPNPFFEAGTIVKGHEFHYSGPTGAIAAETCMEVLSGVGLGYKRDGLLYKNALASYTHIHARGIKSWASAMIANAVRYQRQLRS